MEVHIMDKNAGNNALNDELMEKISGGDGVTIVYDYECKNCGQVWSSSGHYSVCLYCASADLVINDQHTVYSYDGYDVGD